MKLIFILHCVRQTTPLDYQAGRWQRRQRQRRQQRRRRPAAAAAAATSSNGDGRRRQQRCNESRIRSAPRLFVARKPNIVCVCCVNTNACGAPVSSLDGPRTYFHTFYAFVQMKRTKQNLVFSPSLLGKSQQLPRRTDPCIHACILELCSWIGDVPSFSRAFSIVRIHIRTFFVLIRTKHTNQRNKRSNI